MDEVTGAAEGAAGKRTLTQELPIQRKAKGEPEGKEDGAGGSGRTLPGDVRAKMEGAFGADFSSVRVHEGAQAEAAGAVAYTQGTDLHFAPGRYEPHSQKGQELIGHELAHVVQQSQGRGGATMQAKGLEINDDDSLEREADAMGERAARGESVSGGGGTAAAGKPSGGGVIQRYVEKKIGGGGKDWRIADDLSIAIRQDSKVYGGRFFYADASLIASSSSTLKGQGSRLEMTAGSDTITVESDDKKTKKTLNRVIPKNKKDGTSGNDRSSGMMWKEDCGFAAQAAMQGDKTTTKGVYKDKSGKEQTTSSVDYNTDETTYRGVTLYTPHMMADEIIKKAMGESDADKAWAAYHKLSPAEKDKIDKQVGMNKYAQPNVGEAYSIVSNKDEHVEGKTAWNFHWGGVVMRSGGDSVTMENFANSGEDAWDFQMYGPPTKVGQTFHEQQESRTHGSSGQAEYGDHPTTITVRPS